MPSEHIRCSVESSVVSSRSGVTRLVCQHSDSNGTRQAHVWVRDDDYTVAVTKRGRAVSAPRLGPLLLGRCSWIDVVCMSGDYLVMQVPVGLRATSAAVRSCPASHVAGMVDCAARPGDEFATPDWGTRELAG